MFDVDEILANLELIIFKLQSNPSHLSVIRQTKTCQYKVRVYTESVNINAVL